jgi:dUTP pyrophosphatase
MLKVQKMQYDAFIPSRAHPTDAGLDLQCVNDFGLLIGERTLVKLGIAIEIPDGYEAQIRARSGLALKNGVTVLNGVGTVDSSYRGELGVILINHGNDPINFKRGDKIAQLVINKIELFEPVEFDALNHSNRGTGGFGSTGVSA